MRRRIYFLIGKSQLRVLITDPSAKKVRVKVQLLDEKWSTRLACASKKMVLSKMHFAKLFNSNFFVTEIFLSDMLHFQLVVTKNFFEDDFLIFHFCNFPKFTFCKNHTSDFSNSTTSGNIPAKSQIGTRRQVHL